MIDKNGKYVESISGLLPYGPAAETDTLLRTPVYTFINDPLDSKLPKIAFQLIFVVDPFREDEKHGMKDLLDKHFYPLLSFKELAALMYK
jgi:hypothetical protein